LAQAMSGIASRRAEPDAPPEPSATPIADFTGGMLLVQAILLALLARERTGRGQTVHVSLLDGMLAMQLQEASAWLNLGQRLNWGAFPLSGTFATLDGHVVMVGAFKPNPLQVICRGLGIEDLSADPRYATHEAQVAHRDELQARWRQEFGKRTPYRCALLPHSDVRAEALDPILIPMEPAAGLGRDQDLTVVGLEGLSENRVRPVLPLQPVRRLGDTHEVRRHFRVEVRRDLDA